MHLMDETPEKITEKQIVEESIKKKKREDRITKATQKGIPEGVPKIGKVYQKTDKENRIQMENIRIEKQKKENYLQKLEKKTKTTKKGIPKGAQKIEKIYQKTDKDNRIQMENIMIEKQKKENDLKKTRKRRQKQNKKPSRIV